MPETLKDDFMSLVNGLLDTTVHHFQSLDATYTNSTSSERTTQEIEIFHLWITSLLSLTYQNFLNRIISHTGSLSLFMNIELALHSCKAIKYDTLEAIILVTLFQSQVLSTNISVLTTNRS